MLQWCEKHKINIEIESEDGCKNCIHYISDPVGCRYEKWYPGLKTGRDYSKEKK